MCRQSSQWIRVCVLFQQVTGQCLVPCAVRQGTLMYMHSSRSLTLTTETGGIMRHAACSTGVLPMTYVAVLARVAATPFQGQPPQASPDHHLLVLPPLLPQFGFCYWPSILSCTVREGLVVHTPTGGLIQTSVPCGKREHRGGGTVRGPPNPRPVSAPRLGRGTGFRAAQPAPRIRAPYPRPVFAPRIVFAQLLPKLRGAGRGPTSRKNKGHQ